MEHHPNVKAGITTRMERIILYGQGVVYIIGGRLQGWTLEILKPPKCVKMEWWNLKEILVVVMWKEHLLGINYNRGKNNITKTPLSQILK